MYKKDAKTFRFCLKNITIVTTHFQTAEREVIFSNDLHCDKNAGICA